MKPFLCVRSLTPNNLPMVFGLIPTSARFQAAVMVSTTLRHKLLYVPDKILQMVKLDLRYFSGDVRHELFHLDFLTDELRAIEIVLSEKKPYPIEAIQQFKSTSDCQIFVSYQVERIYQGPGLESEPSALALFEAVDGVILKTTGFRRRLGYDHPIRQNEVHLPVAALRKVLPEIQIALEATSFLQAGKFLDNLHRNQQTGVSFVFPKMPTDWDNFAWLLEK